MKKYIIKEDVLKGVLEAGGLRGKVDNAGNITIVKETEDKVIIIGKLKPTK